MAEYAQQYVEFLALETDVAALSVDPPEVAATLRDETRVPFTLLCDPDKKVTEAWGLLNTHEHGGIPFPAVFVIGKDMRVRYRSLDQTTSRIHADALLHFLRTGQETEETRRRWVLPGPGDIVRGVRNLIVGHQGAPRA